jgi:hypothetical protein
MSSYNRPTGYVLALVWLIYVLLWVYVYLPAIRRYERRQKV